MKAPDISGAFWSLEAHRKTDWSIFCTSPHISVVEVILWVRITEKVNWLMILCSVSQCHWEKRARRSTVYADLSATALRSVLVGVNS